MKSILFSVSLFLTFFAAAQDTALVHCRPRIVMISYGYHDDAAPNAIMTTIKTIRPDIVVENTIHGYWGEQNGGVGCHPSEYTPLGIKVFSYIASGWGSTYNQSRMIDSLPLNLLRIEGIAADGATGVFLDQVCNFPDASCKNYIEAIYNKCQSLGLKLILNPGTSTFDSWLMSHCDYILTDEHYSPRAATSSELPYLDRVLVVAQNITTAQSAAAISLGARANGFLYSYACDEYISLPAYLGDYEMQIKLPPVAAVVTQNGLTLHSNYQFGNVWYEASQGPVVNATNQNFTPIMDGNYYSIVTLDGCSSDTSNKIAIIGTSVKSVAAEDFVRLYPNPASNFVRVEIDKMNTKKIAINVYDMIGSLVLSEVIDKSAMIDVTTLADGVYFFAIQSEGSLTKQKLAIQK